MPAGLLCPASWAAGCVCAWCSMQGVLHTSCYACRHVAGSALPTATHTHTPFASHADRALHDARTARPACPCQVYYDPYPNTRLEEYMKQYGQLLAHHGEPPVFCKRLETVEEVLKVSDVSVPPFVAGVGRRGRDAFACVRLGPSPVSCTHTHRCAHTSSHKLIHVHTHE
eukprot:365661-Chlamydomonas_euryale.AAC.43